MDIFVGLIILGLIIYLVFEIMRFVKLRAKFISRKEFKKAADEQAKKMVYRDPVITCDYCGSKIDTNKSSACPNCGAPYNNDEEWIARHKIKEDDIDDSTNRIVKEVEDKAQQEAKKALTHIKWTVLALVIFIVCLGIVGVAMYQAAPESGYRTTETLEVFDKYNSYKDADYQIVGDGVIYDYDGVKVTLTNLYVQDNPYNREKTGVVAAEFQVENNMDQNVTVSMGVNAVDGLARESSFMYMYSKYKKNSTVTVYERIRDVPDKSVSEMIFNEVKVYTSSFEYSHSIDEPVVITTTADTRYETETDGWVQIYTNDSVDLYVTLPVDYSRDGYKFMAINKTDNVYYVSSDDLRVDGMAANSGGIYKAYMPANYTFHSGIVSSYDEQYKTLSDKEVKISITFNCPADPAKSFSTGYLDISHTIFQ